MNLYQILKKATPFLPVLFLLWMILALYLTLFPGELLTSAASWGDPKIGHIILFGVWTLLFGLMLLLYYEQRNISVLLIVIAGILFGGLVELMQFLMPFDRSGSLADIGLNAIGATFAGIFLFFFKARYMKTTDAQVD